jgi:hypothetical protein
VITILLLAICLWVPYILRRFVSDRKHQHNFVLTITNGGPAGFGRAFLLQQRGSFLLGGSTVDRQQAYDPQGVCDPEFLSKPKKELHDDPRLQ